MTTPLIIALLCILAAALFAHQLARRLGQPAPHETQPSKRPLRGDLYLWQQELNRKDHQ